MRQTEFEPHFCLYWPWDCRQGAQLLSVDFLSEVSEVLETCDIGDNEIKALGMEQVLYKL